MDEVSIEAAGEALPLADEILFFPCLVVWSGEIRVVHRTLSSRWKNCRPLFMIHPSTVAARSLPRSGRNFIRRTSELAAVRALDDGRRVASPRPSVRPSVVPPLLSHRGPLFDWQSAAGRGNALRRPLALLPAAAAASEGRGRPLSVSGGLTDARAFPTFSWSLE